MEQKFLENQGELPYDSDDSENEIQVKENLRNFNIMVKPMKTVHFVLKFTPNKVNKEYLFELPIILLGYGKIDSLTRNVICKVEKPRCLIEPMEVKFEKKIISSFGEKPTPDTEKIEIVNLDKGRSIEWKIDAKQLNDEKIFIIYTTEGRLDPNNPTSVKVGFNPITPGSYERKVNIYLDRNYSKPYGEIMLKGTGAYPRLTFDRREIVLPIVPLEIESRCTFRIYNDGYENLSLKHEITNDVGNIPVKLEYPEG